jgi:hypothetical protein
MRVLIIMAVLSVAAFSAPRPDTLFLVKADTAITYDTSLVISTYNDTAILVSKDTIPKVSKKVKKVVVPKKEETKEVPVKKDEKK